MESLETSTTQTPNYLGEEIQQLITAITEVMAVEKIICFGNTIHRVVRKSCFEEIRPENGVAQNSYSLLVIPTADNTLHMAIAQQRIEEATKSVAAVIAIVHPMEEVNAALQNGSTFFTSIYKNGTLIHDRNELSFAVPSEGKPIAARITKREKFWDKWHALAKGFLQGATFYRTVEQPNLAVYLLHQAVQHCYAGMLRVLTGYRTNSNGLNRLLRLIDATVSYPAIALPRQTEEDIRLTGILLKGHSDARYKDSFEATPEDVMKLMNCVTTIIDAADRRCRERIQQLKDGKVAYVA
ncbi:HEPN domain-containing protein [Parapedobacter tibetensis]|uniref:HEPN domain-containing protein n=1 Tax=Parapedobacter tibetensis TaxID=2972951 RepID=UPI00214D80F3|nr:HEPN domain-containing protein [Parapedobacter tibetensis]